MSSDFLRCCQIIIESAENGNDDFIWDAMKLFIDLVGIFVRKLVRGIRIRVVDLGVAVKRSGLLRNANQVRCGARAPQSLLLSYFLPSVPRHPLLPRPPQFMVVACKRVVVACKRIAIACSP